MVSTTKPVEAPLAAWKTLVLGGVLGFVLALTFVGHEGPNAVFNGRRWLNEEGGAVVEHSPNEETEELDVTTVDTTVTVIVLLLIVLTIAFETIKHHIEHSADRNMRPIISSLFGEMTVLGFLSIFTFCVTKLGFFEKISTQLFGEEEEEALLETFEFVHYMLFFVMVFFVISVLTLVGGAKKTEKTWSTMDRACRDAHYLMALDDLESRDESRNPGKSGWFVYFAQSVLLPTCFRSKSKDYRKSLSLFRGLRSEFVLERSLVAPFSPNATNHVEEDFNYGQYLGICLGHELAHVVHVNLLTWVFFAILTVLLYGVVMALDNQITTFAWVWAATGWLLVMVGNIFDYHIVCLLQSLTVRSPSNSTHSNENDALLNDSALPAWTQIDMDSYHRNRSFLVKCLGHGNGDTSKITKQDALYWMDRKGPKVYMIMFQIQLVFTSAYVSLLLLSFVEHVFEYCELLVAIAYTVVSVLPIYLVVSKYQESAANVAMASSFGIHRRPQAVAQVIRDEKVGRIIRAMVVVCKLERKIETGFSVESSGGHSHHGTSTTSHNSGGHSHHGTSTTSHTDAPGSHAGATGENGSSSSTELEEVAKSFDALDPSGNGRIESRELRNVFEAMGVHTSDENMAAILHVLDKNGDGHVAKDEFLSFYSQHVLSTVGVDEHSLHEMAHDLYHRFDRDHSGQITLGEFKDVLDAFNVGFTVNEIGHLVNELDEHDDGQVGEHEFLELLKKHRYIFEKHELPSLQ